MSKIVRIHVPIFATENTDLHLLCAHRWDSITSINLLNTINYGIATVRQGSIQMTHVCLLSDW